MKRRKLLYIEASVNKEKSRSIALAQYFIRKYKEKYTTAEIDTWDIWNSLLPEIKSYRLEEWDQGPEGAGQSYFDKEAWYHAERCIHRFMDVDDYLIALPVWNFGIPYRMKHFIDIITQPGHTFFYDLKTKPKELFLNKSCTVIFFDVSLLSNRYPKEQENPQVSYIFQWLNFLGFKNINTVFFELDAKDTVTFNARHPSAEGEVDVILRKLK